MDHICHIDCTPEFTPTGGIAHIMYPSDPNSAAGRYQAARNLELNRRRYRASGQDETRAVREWNYNRAQKVGV